MFIYLLFANICLCLKISLTRHTKTTQHKLQTTLDNFHNLQYSGHIELGGQDLQLLFDTGSSVFWVFSNHCDNCQNTQYDCQESPTCLTTQDQYEVQYGQGQINGYKSYDNVKIAGLSVTNVQFLLVTQQKYLQELHANGICGLGLQKNEGFESIINQLFNQNLIQKRIFSFFLNSVPGQINNNSILFIGDYDFNYIKGNPNYISINNNNQWIISINKINLNNQTLINNTINALIDTGTSLIVIPTQQFSQLLSQLRDVYNQFCQYSQQQIKCSCPDGIFNKFPNIIFQINDFILELQPKDYITIEISTCILGITKSSNDYWIMGDVLLRKYITIFDMDNKKIGFGELISFQEQSQQIQISDSLFIFKVILTCICLSILTIFIIRYVSDLSNRNHDLIK